MKQYALVTGASSGMGYCYAEALARRGYNVLMVSNEDVLIERADTIRKQFSVDIIPLVMDLGTQDAAEKLHSYCREKQLEIEVLINNAGVYHDCDFLEDSVAFNMLILNLHMITPAMLAYYFGQDMVQRGKGYILNVSSITDRVAVQRMGSYGATKAFLSAHSRSLHVELKNKGVIVTTVRPGAVNTGLYSIRSFATKMGLFMGYIVSPEHLVNRALNALFHGRARVTVPWGWNNLLLALVALVPTSLLLLIRRLKWF